MYPLTSKSERRASPRALLLSVLFCGGLLAVAAAGAEQSSGRATPCLTRVSVSFRGSTLEDIFFTLRALTGLEVWIEDEARGKTLSAELEEIPLTEALGSLLDPTGLSYALVVNPSDPCQVDKIYVGGAGTGATSSIKPLDSGEEAPPGAMPEPPGGEAKPVEPVAPAASSESPAGESPAGAPREPVPHPGVPASPAAAAEGPGQVEAPGPAGAPSGETSPGSESAPSSADAPSEKETPASGQGAPAPEEEDVSSPPPPDPMNLYRFFAGDRRTLLYHRLSCRDAMFTPPEAKAWFESEQQARGHGFSPHPVCLIQQP